MGFHFGGAVFVSCLLASVLGCRARPEAPSAALVKEIAPSGTLRVGVVVGPTRSAFFVTEDAGKPSGVTVELGTRLAQQIGLPLEIVTAPNSGELVDKTASGALDVAFMPMDEERKQRVDFGPAYFVIESTYLVTGSSGIQKLADIDRPNVRIVGIANTATIRAAGKSLHQAMLTPARSIDDALALLAAGKADALALTHDSLPPLAAKIPGSRILEGAFLQAGVAIAVPKERPLALAYVSEFLQGAKATGVVQQAFEHAGLQGLAVAP
jgi:polar amino acid transport system substrate-binding protein